MNEEFEMDIYLKGTLLLLLSVLDSILTLAIIGTGGSELNPIMDLALREGSVFFFLSKFLLVFISILILTVIYNIYRIEMIQKIISVFIVIYMSIVGWEIYLISMCR